eukprot:3671529-Pleurochrysis_carterae.AAC.1
MARKEVGANKGAAGFFWAGRAHAASARRTSKTSLKALRREQLTTTSATVIASPTCEERSERMESKGRWRHVGEGKQGYVPGGTKGTYRGLRWTTP